MHLKLFFLNEVKKTSVPKRKRSLDKKQKPTFEQILATSVLRVKFHTRMGLESVSVECKSAMSLNSTGCPVS